MANIELPKDAEGREIPLDVAVLYNKDGNDLYTDRATYMRLTDDWWFFGHFGSHTDTHRIAAADLYLTPPDSWEKLEEDLDRCIEASDSCRYYSTSGICAKCTRPDNDGRGCTGCTAVIFSDIKKRIRELRGED